MTQFNLYPIRCSCKNIVDVEIYDSVNVTVSPLLLNKVRRKKINNFKCDNCGNESELAHRFLYVDMKKGLWIWCYPSGDRENRKEIVKVLTEGKVAVMSKYVERLGQQEPKIVFGYDELLALI